MMIKFRIIVAGGRHFNDYLKLTKTLNHMLSILPKGDIEIVSGKAKGADHLGELYASDNNLSVALFPADWDTYGKAAGYRRNAEMADYGTHLVAFWDGESRGTKSMIELAKKKGLKVSVVKY